MDTERKTGQAACHRRRIARTGGNKRPLFAKSRDGILARPPFFRALLPHLPSLSEIPNRRDLTWLIVQSCSPPFELAAVFPDVLLHCAQSPERTPRPLVRSFLEALHISCLTLSVRALALTRDRDKPNSSNPSMECNGKNIMTTKDARTFGGFLFKVIERFIVNHGQDHVNLDIRQLEEARACWAP